VISKHLKEVAFIGKLYDVDMHVQLHANVEAWLTGKDATNFVSNPFGFC
jgi:hypothetical protein